MCVCACGRQHRPSLESTHLSITITFARKRNATIFFFTSEVCRDCSNGQFLLGFTSKGEEKETSKTEMESIRVSCSLIYFSFFSYVSTRFFHSSSTIASPFIGRSCVPYCPCMCKSRTPGWSASFFEKFPPLMRSPFLFRFHFFLLFTASQIFPPRLLPFPFFSFVFVSFLNFLRCIIFFLLIS